MNREKEVPIDFASLPDTNHTVARAHLQQSTIENQEKNGNLPDGGGHLRIAFAAQAAVDVARQHMRGYHECIWPAPGRANGPC